MSAASPTELPAQILQPASIHASALVVGEEGFLIRGDSGAGKSSLVLAMLDLAARRNLFARLVADDRVRLQAAGDRLLASPHPAIAGMIEARGAGIVHAIHEGRARITCVVDLLPEGASPPRLPEDRDLTTRICDIPLRRVAVPAGLPVETAARRVLAFFSYG